jgi:hypothetical protein
VRSSPRWISSCAGVAGWLLLAAVVRAGPAERADRYRADALDPVPPVPPEAVQLVHPPGAPVWPATTAAELEARIRSEWPASRIYGPVHSSLGVWLDDPLVTAEIGGRVLVPVIDGAALPIAGSLDIPREARPRRVVVLVDASASANALAPFAGPDGSAEQIAVLEAERRALDHLVSLLERSGLELGVIAFGESTWPIAEPGLSLVQLRERLARFRATRPRGEGRTDAVCALWTARGWLASSPAGVEREIVVLTDGELPHSGRFADCDAEAARRGAQGVRACLERRNRSLCPAQHELRAREGDSDLAQLAAFARRTRGELRITPLVFELERAAQVWEQLARRSGSRLVRVPSARAVESVLPALVSSRIGGVRAYNMTSGEASLELLDASGRDFAGSLPLLPGGNDIELRVAGERGIAALLRFRVYSEPGYLVHALGRLRERNEALEARVRALGTGRGARPGGALRIEPVARRGD